MEKRPWALLYVSPPQAPGAEPIGGILKAHHSFVLKKLVFAIVALS